MSTVVVVAGTVVVVVDDVVVIVVAAVVVDEVGGVEVEVAGDVVADETVGASTASTVDGEVVSVLQPAASTIMAASIAELRMMDSFESTPAHLTIVTRRGT